VDGRRGAEEFVLLGFGDRFEAAAVVREEVLGGEGGAHVVAVAVVVAGDLPRLAESVEEVGHVGAEGVIQLQSVYAQMDMRRAEARGGDEPGQRRNGALHLRRFNRIDQVVEQRLQRLDRQQIVAVSFGNDVGGFRKACGIIREILEGFYLLIDCGYAEI